MTVQVINLQNTSGLFNAIRYTETFNRADQPFFLGNNWNFQVSDATTNAPSVMAAGVNVSVSPSFATMGTSNGTNARSIFTPAFVNRARITALSLTRGEYSQFTVTGILPGVSTAIGPVVFNPSPNDGNCYLLALDSATGIAQLIRGVGSSATILNPNVFSFVANDIIRLEAVVSSAADNTIRGYKNGVLQFTIVDNNGARPNGGMYGIGWFSSNVGTISFKDYDGGIL